MSRKKVLMLGGNFGGLTAALAVSYELHGDVDSQVISASDRFVFNPSLIWLPFGKRRPADITFPLAPTFEDQGIEFTQAEATGSTWPRRRSPRPPVPTTMTTWYRGRLSQQLRRRVRARPGRQRLHDYHPG